jgi:hypothetical protein
MCVLKVHPVSVNLNRRVKEFSLLARDPGQDFVLSLGGFALFPLLELDYDGVVGTVGVPSTNKTI